MLYIFEAVINKNFLEQPINWFFSLAVPITLLWLGILWAMVFLYRLFKINAWYAAGIFFIISLFGTIITNAIAAHQTLQQRWNTGDEMISILSCSFLAILCFVIGITKRKKTDIDSMNKYK